MEYILHYNHVDNHDYPNEIHFGEYEKMVRHIEKICNRKKVIVFVLGTEIGVYVSHKVEDILLPLNHIHFMRHWENFYFQEYRSYHEAYDVALMFQEDMDHHLTHHHKYRGLLDFK
jgi:hypothetical protein